MVEMSIPHLFRCPISLDLFIDPVTLCTGQTYDRCSIQKWLEDGNLTCPVTMQPLHDTTLVPNHTLRHLIEQWVLKGPDPNHQLKQPSPGRNSVPTNDMEWSLTTLKCLLQSESATSDAKIEVLKKVRNLSIESDVGRACLIQLGFFPLLLELIFQSPTAFLLCNQELLELSLHCLLTLSPSSHLDSLDKVLTKDPNFASLVLFLGKGNAKIKISLCYLLETIAMSESIEALTIKIGQSPCVMQSLVSILDTKTDLLVSDACVRAINGLCHPMVNRENAIKEGAMHSLVKYLLNTSTTKNASPKALAALDCLLELEIGKKNIIANLRDNNLIKVLVKHIFVVSSENEGSEYAASILLTMCRDSSWARGKAAHAGVVTQLLFLIQSQCNSRAKTKARALLMLLRSKFRRCDQKM